MIRFNHILSTWEFVGHKGIGVSITKKQARSFVDAGVPVIVSETTVA